MKTVEASQSQFIFYTSFYGLLAAICHQDTCWMWDDVLARKDLKQWYTLYLDFSHDYRFVGFWFMFWLASSFTCALFPFHRIFRLAAAISTTYIFTLWYSHNVSLTSFLMDSAVLLPTWCLALMPRKSLSRFLEDFRKPDLKWKDVNRNHVLVSLFFLIVAFWFPHYSYRYGLIFIVALWSMRMIPKLTLKKTINV